MVRALYIPEGEEPRIIEVKDDLKSLQKLVGGNIEEFSPLFDDEPLLWVNEEGLYKCNPNRTVIANWKMEKEGYLSQIDGSEVKEGDLYAVLFGPILAMSYDMTDDLEVFARDITEKEVEAVIECLGGPGSGTRAVRRFF